MCVTKDGGAPQTPVKTKISPDISENQVQSLRSPWAKLLFRQPKLSRKIVPSAKVNLNKYWSKFGDLLTSPSSKNSLCHRLSKLNMEDSVSRVDVKKRLIFEDDESNREKSADNNNISPPCEKSRYLLIDDELNESDDNLANEIREICYSTIKNCKCFQL